MPRDETFFESISSLSGYFSTLSLNPPKKIIKEKTRNIFVLVGVLHFCSKDLSLAFVWGTSLSVVVTNFQKIGASCWKKRSTKKILCQIIAYERPSLDDKHVFQLLGLLLLLQANHSKNATLQVTFFPSSTYLSLVVVFRILCTFLAILFVKIKLKTKNQYLI